MSSIPALGMLWLWEGDLLWGLGEEVLLGREQSSACARSGYVSAGFLPALQALFTALSLVSTVPPPAPPLLRLFWTFLETMTLAHSKSSDSRRRIEKTRAFLLGGFNPNTFKANPQII